MTFASYIGLPLNELTAQSDVIARVRVLSIRANPHRKHVAQHALPYDAGELYQIATVDVVENFYGTRNGARLVIHFNNGALCPNVWYRKGEERVVFLGQEGRLCQTLNFDNGAKSWGSPNDYRNLRQAIRQELAKLTAPAYKGLRGKHLRAWEETKWRLESARYTLRHKIQNTYRNTTGEKYPYSLDWISPY